MSEDSQPAVSIIIPCFNEKDYIANTVRLSFEQDYPREKLEVIVADGLSTDGTREILSDLQKSESNLVVLDNENKTVPFAFNMSIPISKGEVIVILGAHSEIPSNYVSTLTKHLVDLKAANVGGVLETLPPDDSSKSRAIAMACSSKIGMGNSQFRIGSDEVKEVDTVPFGCYRKSIFDEVGLFDTELTRNQDDEFNGRVTKSGGKIFLIPNIRLKYFSRTTYAKLWTMFYQYGLFKPLAAKKVGSPTTVRQLVPPMFVLGTWSLLLGSIFYQPLILLFALMLVLYESLIGLSAIRYKTENKSLGVLWHFALSVHVIHWAYGTGYIRGLIRFVLLNQKPQAAKFKSSR